MNIYMHTTYYVAAAKMWNRKLWRGGSSHKDADWFRAERDASIRKAREFKTWREQQ